ncbi:MAG: hypothetical protein RSB32_05940 [Mucinivorans sp.]
MAKNKKKQITLKVTVPTGWGDLTSHQVARVAAEILSAKNQDEILVSLAVEFAGLMPRGTSLNENGDRVYLYYHRDCGNVTLDAEQITAIVDAMRWLSVDNIAPMAAPELDGYFKPDQKLRSATVEQFVTADVAFMSFLRNGDQRALRVLAAIFYAREKYDPDKLQFDAARMERLDAQLYGVFLWFSGAKILLAKEFPSVFDGDDSSDQSSNSPRSGAEYLLEILTSLNGGDVTKNEQIKSLNVYEALHELNNKIDKSKNNV